MEYLLKTGFNENIYKFKELSGLSVEMKFFQQIEL